VQGVAIYFISNRILNLNIKILYLLLIACFLSLIYLILVYDNLPRQDGYWSPILAIFILLSIVISRLREMVMPIFLVMIGDISFELYLLHVPLLKIIPANTDFQKTLGSFLIIILSFSVSIFLDKPLRRSLYRLLKLSGP
jgi:peptidoglycan/LPS O-acetylase OafA/YrhL